MAVADALATVAILSTPLLELNGSGAPASGMILVGDGSEFQYNEFMAYLQSRIHPVTVGGRTSLMFGSGVGTVPTGGFNVGIGYAAMAAVVTGTGNTSIGYQAHTALTSGTGNTAIGLQGQNDLTTGTFNTTVGAYSMDTAAGVALPRNTAVGYLNLLPVTGHYNSALV